VSYLIQQCKFCLKQSKLHESHIIPEFIYNPIYSKKHKLIKVSGSLEGPNPEVIQKGLRERLLCSDCEKFLNDNFERPSVAVWKVLTSGNSSGCISLRKIGDDKGNIAAIVSGFDYVSFKLFLLSILWRISISCLEDFQDISLGPHEDIIRKRLLGLQPGSQSDYPCIISLLDGPTFTPIYVPPLNPRHEGHRMFRLILTNVLVWFVISKHCQRAPLTGLSVKEDGSLIAALLGVPDITMLRETYKMIKACDIPNYMFSK
jgi:hypothetical protein